MARVELRRSVFGDAIVGEVQTAPALSWSEHDALVRAERNTSELASRAQAIARQLESMGLDLQATAASISALEIGLGLRLDAQTRLLGQQVALLDETADVLRTPAKTRAAERLADVGELLRRQRWKRALSVAEEITHDDPNNPEGFLACAWANLGLGQIEPARDAYIEAAEAADGLRASELGRQAARLFATRNTHAAQEILERFAITQAATWPDVTWEEREAIHTSIRERTELGGVNYDRAVYAAANGETEIARKALKEAGELSPEFLVAAQKHAILLQHPELTAEASKLLGPVMVDQQAKLAAQHQRAAALVVEFERLELEESDPDASVTALRGLVEELDRYIQAPAPLISGKLTLHDLLLDHVEQQVIPGRRASQEAQAQAEADRLRRARVQALRDDVEQTARELAAKTPGASVAPTQRSVVVHRVDIPIWVVVEPGGFLRSEKKWHVSATDGRPSVTRYY